MINQKPIDRIRKSPLITDTQVWCPWTPPPEMLNLLSPDILKILGIYTVSGYSTFLVVPINGRVVERQANPMQTQIIVRCTFLWEWITKGTFGMAASEEPYITKATKWFGSSLGLI